MNSTIFILLIIALAVITVASIAYAAKVIIDLMDK